MTSRADDGPTAGILPARRLVAVHAHPDDETLSSGVTLARYAAEGAGVTLVTCTLGEEGEVIPTDLAHLQGSDQLAARRADELARAAAALGVHDHRLLGGGRWRDSGMAWLAPGVATGVTGARPDAFVRADLEQAAGMLADVLREVRPQVVLTYDPQGGYGHPDHVMAHRVTMRAVELAAPCGGAAGWAVGAVHWIQVPRSWADGERRAVRSVAAVGGLPEPMVAPGEHDDHPPLVLPDLAVDVVVEAPEQVGAVVAALHAHATQVRVVPPWLALSNDVARLLPTREAFRRVSGPPVAAADRPATDLFAGLDLTVGA